MSQLVETILQDVRAAVRGFRRSPGFALTAIAMLALGTGATTAIFAALSAVLLQPLPYPNSRDLYSLRSTLTDGRVTTGLVSGGELYRLNDPTLSIERAGGAQPRDLTLIGADGTPAHLQVVAVTEGFFELFGLPMTLGGFTHDDFRPVPSPPSNSSAEPGPPPRIVISNRMWNQAYKADPDIVGKPIHFAEFSSTILGVAPRGFDIPRDADVWIAQRLSSTDANHGQDAFVRLKRGTSIDRAKRDMATVMDGLARDFPAADRGRAFVSRPLVDSIVGDLRPILIIVMAATGLLLLLACVNVANLLLARAAARSREMAVRAALGAGWGRIVRQLLTESVVLATVGTIAGVAVGAAGLRGLLAVGAAKLPRLAAVPFNAPVLLFALVTLIVTAAIIGLAPAMRLARSDIKTLMNDSSRSASVGRGTARWLMGMTVAEVALAIILVAGAGWLVRGFSNLRHINPGFVPDKRLLFDVSFLGARYPNPDAVRQAELDFIRVIRGIPGVANVGLVSAYPMTGRLESSLVARFHGEPFDAANPAGTRQRFASPGLFATMGTPLINGRDFATSDLPTTQPVAVVNKAFVDRYLKGRNPIGVQFGAGYPDPQGELTIVGVVGDVRQKSLNDPAEPAFYIALTQFPSRRTTAVVSTLQSEPEPVERAIRVAVRKLDPTMALDFQLASGVVNGTLGRQELGMTLMLTFGSIAVALAAVGIYGVVSYAGSLRRAEMATRLALGASPLSVFVIVMKQGAILGVVGAALGLGLAYSSGQLIAHRVYAIRVSSPLILTTATLLITAITLMATTIPAIRSARLKPADALRSE